MGNGSGVATTQRAYTLRLRGVNAEDQSWREALWATHEAVNRGAKVFGDWLLTLRGGLEHALADQGPPEQRKERRILLALSWLTVEDSRGAPEEHEVPRPKVVEVFEEILWRRGLSEQEIREWVNDCQLSLEAEIRTDGATWVNRSAAFDDFTRRTSVLPDRAYAARTVLQFLELKNPYFALPSLQGDASPPGGSEDERPLVNEATGWLCDNWGAGEKSDKSGISQRLKLFVDGDLSRFVGQPGIALLTELCRLADAGVPGTADATVLVRCLNQAIGWKGRPSAARMAIEATAASPGLGADAVERLTQKLLKESQAKLAESRVTVPGWMPAERARLERLIGMPYRGQKDHTFEVAVMLDHALRRVSGAHSWIKNAEAERRRFETDAQRLADVPAEARAWLESYCEARRETSGGIEPYRIRKRAIDGWDSVVARWSLTDCVAAEGRIKAARRLQDDPDEKFGDIQLFEALAADDALCVWKPGGKPSSAPLKDFVFVTDAMAKRRRFKVPAYRHPDPLRNPVFVDFGNSRWEIRFDIHELYKLKGKKRPKNTQDFSPRGLRMDLWDGGAMRRDLPLQWGCKRLVNDLGLNSTVGVKTFAVTRADRAGRAVAGAEADAPVNVLGLFQQKDWNGRLQAPRRELDAIGRHVDRHGWNAKAHRMRQHTRWLLSFSAKLTPQGPWTELAARLGLKLDPQYWPHAEANKSRKAHARLVLSRLPGLRVLSVDLGHRFAAACAVWEAITSAQMLAACEAAGASAPAAGAMYVHLKSTGGHGNDTATIYRRIGPDVLPDGSPHPAPWARLDRQFLIKLQGESRRARKASHAEVEAVQAFESWVGLVRKNGEPRDLSVDRVMSDAVRTARLALSRHGRRARIAFNLTANVRVRPGDIKEVLTDKTRTQLLADTLADWHALATDTGWDDEAARSVWNSTIARLPGGFAVARADGATRDHEPTRAERKKAEEGLLARLWLFAQALAGDKALCARLRNVWSERWIADDKQWPAKLKWLSRWLMPRGGARREAKRRHVGGLSLVRISSFVDFRRRVQVGFFTRLTPDGTRAETGKRFGQKTLDRIERLKDNRTKQLASRIIEAALGIGIERHAVDGRDIARPRERINDPRFAPCHAVVVEDLEHYRPEETRTRRENRQTMDWKSAETRKRLADHCQLYGLHLRDVNPQYTSRQDSRTGAPGMRCVDVEVGTFVSAALWQKQVG